MNRALVIISGTAVLAALAVGLAFAWIDAADSHDHDDGFGGMMEAMGDGDHADIMAHMRQVLTAEEYRLMEQHMADHANGGGMAVDPTMDGMMHRMMDGMMGNMGGRMNR